MKNLVILAVVSGLFVSCAGTSPSARVKQAIGSEDLVTSKDAVTVQVTSLPSTSMELEDQTRVAQRLTSRINGMKSTRPTVGKPKTFLTVVNFTEYKKGNSLARAMMAGLGQIRLKADVNHYESGRLAGSFSASKVFAWGGAYGGMVSIEDIEGAFAGTIAETVTGVNQ